MNVFRIIFENISQQAVYVYFGTEIINTIRYVFQQLRADGAAITFEGKWQNKA